MARYNNRIKRYMRDVNAVKKASADTSQVSTHFNRAVESFWPDQVAHMKTLLLEQPDQLSFTTINSSSKYESVISFRCLVTGAVCVWQECWNVLQTCTRKTVQQQPYIDQLTKALDEMKTDLIRDIDKRHYRQVALRVFSLQSIYLYLQAQRMRTFIKNRRLLLILNGICARDPLHLQIINTELRSNFRLYQRDNIEDFLLYLEDYFQPKMKERLEKKTWLICEQGREYGVFVCKISVTYTSDMK